MEPNMALTLYAHPFSSYCQKVLIALYENATPFDLRQIDFGDEGVVAELAALWPLKRMPVLVDHGRPIMEASIIIEHLALYHPGPVALLPSAAKEALDIRFMDRFFDNYVMTPMQRIVFNHIRPPEDRDSKAEEDARALLTAAYRWLDTQLDSREWAAGDSFTLADCAAAPSLFYADWVHPIGDMFPRAQAYRARLLARPSFARAVDEARPYRHFFPPGAPDRD
jgi:glutathione S-transferase